MTPDAGSHRAPFNRGWTVQPRTNAWAQLTAAGREPEPVTLPHDALINQPRDPANKGATVYFPTSSAFEYAKSFPAPEDWRGRRVSLEFQGAYRDAMIYVNGAPAVHWAYGYSTFTVPLDDFLAYDADNTIRVEVRAHEDARWYTGVGLFREVTLIVTDLVHVSPDGITVTTPDVNAERVVVEIAVPVTNSGLSTRTVTVQSQIRDTEASDSSPITLRPGETGIARHRVYVQAPHRWSVENPYLYTVSVAVRDGETILDAVECPLGIRTLRLDPIHGLRINDEVVKLRGACVHHDNGILGAAAIGRAEERRVELLKQAGFNAIRSAHNPISPALLDACDRIGMLVLDEAFDQWTEPKSPFDHATAFTDWWERDLTAMVRKDRNHPSVICYSIGNEIPETGSPLGSGWGRRLAEKVRELDDTRFVTNAVNGFVSVLTDVVAMMRARAGDAAEGGVNSAGELMNSIASSPLVTARIEESLSVLDIAGLNYAESRYEPDRTRYPNRIILGTETFPDHIAGNWRLVTDNPHVLGDFTWTGWDYLGEAGIGRLRYTDDAESGFEAPFPWRTAWCGDLDLTGYRRPQSYYREIVFGLRHEPYIAVQRPHHHGREPVPTLSQWAWPDALSSWTWSADAGAPITVEVYSDADEIELQLNGRVLDRQPAGRDHDFRARFALTYEPGELTAIAHTAGQEPARTTLRTATGDPTLAVTIDRPELHATDADLAFVTIELRDTNGVLVTNADRRIDVTVSGAGVLQGLGTGQPDSTEPFHDSHCTTFDGRALAIIRPTAEGDLHLKISADGLTETTHTLHVTT